MVRFPNRWSDCTWKSSYQTLSRVEDIFCCMLAAVSGNLYVPVSYCTQGVIFSGFWETPGSPKGMQHQLQMETQDQQVLGEKSVPRTQSEGVC